MVSADTLKALRSQLAELIKNVPLEEFVFTDFDGSRCVFYERPVITSPNSGNEAADLRYLISAYKDLLRSRMS